MEWKKRNVLNAMKLNSFLNFTKDQTGQKESQASANYAQANMQKICDKNFQRDLKNMTENIISKEPTGLLRMISQKCSINKMENVLVVGNIKANLKDHLMLIIATKLRKYEDFFVGIAISLLALQKTMRKHSEILLIT